MKNLYLHSKNVVKIIVAFVFIFCFNNICSSQETLLLKESFEGDASNYDANTFDDGKNDYFTVLSNASSKIPDQWTTSLNSINGTYFVAAEDVDNNDDYPTILEGYVVLSSRLDTETETITKKIIKQ